MYSYLVNNSRTATKVFRLFPLVIISVAFRMYDLDGDDRISKEELLAVLTMMVGANISEDQLISIAERTIMEADVDKDNLISFEEFKKVLERTDVEQKMSIRFLS
jgi:calcineurin B family protein 1